MKRRKKWKAPNLDMANVKQLWSALYPTEPWPKGWKVAWAGFMHGAYGLCIGGEKRVLLSYGDCKRKEVAVTTLIHEFIHMRGAHRHNADFMRMLNSALTRVGFEPRANYRCD